MARLWPVSLNKRLIDGIAWTNNLLIIELIGWDKLEGRIMDNAGYRSLAVLLTSQNYFERTSQVGHIKSNPQNLPPMGPPPPMGGFQNQGAGRA